MKIVFIQPKSFHTWEALNLGYIASYARRHGLNDFKFFSGFYDTDDEIITGCKDADVIGFTCTSPHIKHAEYLASKIKRPGNYIVFGGVHPSCLPEQTLENENIDAVVVGEGEEAFLDILKGNKEKIVKKPYLKDLDLLPFPDRALIKQERNIQQAFRDNGYRIASIFSSRGCPFRCTFCASHAVWTRKVRFRSPENILEEFKTVSRDLAIDFIKFSDDTYTLRKDNVHAFCRLKIRSGLKTAWGCNVRADTIDDEGLRLMKEAGCREVWIGVESGSPKIIKQMRKGVSLEKIKWAFKRTAELGFFRRAYMMLGMPEESREDIRMSEDLVDEIRPDSVGWTILAPYPGTEFFDIGKHRDVDWSTVDEYENRMTRTRHLTNDDLHAEQARLVARYRDLAVFRQRNNS